MPRCADLSANHLSRPGAERVLLRSREHRPMPPAECRCIPVLLNATPTRRVIPSHAVAAESLGDHPANRPLRDPYMSAMRRSPGSWCELSSHSEACDLHAVREHCADQATEGLSWSPSAGSAGRSRRSHFAWRAHLFPSGLPDWPSRVLESSRRSNGTASSKIDWTA